MAYVLWIFVTLCPLLAHSQSGDDGDAETIVPVCSSMISTKTSNLTCKVDEDDIDSIQHVKLCLHACNNGILGNDSFSFADLPSILGDYKLHMYLKGGGVKIKKINLVKIVKIPTPRIHNVTLESDMVIIHIKYQHDFVTEPKFQVEVWGAVYGATDRLSVTVDYQPVTIGAQVLKGNGIYHVHVKASPENSFFNGSWTAWSPVKKFNVSNLKEVSNPEDPPYVTYIIICTSVILVIGLLMLVFLRWKNKIQAYISPNIPNPKATLAHIHREKERPPVSFSPEIFNDISINRVDYAEAKQLDPELEEEGQDDTTGSCQTEEEDDGEDSSIRVEEEKSHLKIKLLDQPEEGENEVGRMSVASVRRDCRDETYVTMSSLYRTE